MKGVTEARIVKKVKVGSSRRLLEKAAQLARELRARSGGDIDCMEKGLCLQQFCHGGQDERLLTLIDKSGTEAIVNVYRVCTATCSTVCYYRCHAMLCTELWLNDDSRKRPKTHLRLHPPQSEYTAHRCPISHS